MKTFLNDILSDAQSTLKATKVGTIVTAWDGADIAEAVANDYHRLRNRRPTEQQAAEWLRKHSRALEEAMYYAARDYIREHWPCPTCGLIRKTFGCYDACGHPDRVAERG
jgi:hypothetical protein